MTKQEILTKLIPYYEGCIEELKNMDDDGAVIDYLQEKHIDEGICVAIKNICGIDYLPCTPKWIVRNWMPISKYWAQTPDIMLAYHGLDACIKVLQIRVNIMKKELLIIE